MKPSVISKSVGIVTGALTTSYVTGNAINIQNKNQISMLVDYVKGSSTDARIKVEFSGEDKVFYQEVYLDNASGTTVGNVFSDPVRFHEYVLELGGAYDIPIPVNAWYVRFSVKASTSGAGTSLGLSILDGIA